MNEGIVGKERGKGKVGTFGEYDMPPLYDGYEEVEGLWVVKGHGVVCKLELGVDLGKFCMVVDRGA